MIKEEVFFGLESDFCCFDLEEVLIMKNFICYFVLDVRRKMKYKEDVEVVDL